MGWLFQRDPIDDPLAYLSAKYNYDCETHALQTLDGARVGNAVYLAVRSTVKKTGCSFVFAAVILISNTRKHGFGYKDMTETMGPCECDCPQRIMRLLSPIADIPYPSYAAEWRARVAARRIELRRQRDGADRCVLAASSRWHPPPLFRRPYCQPFRSLIFAARRRSSRRSTGPAFTAACTAPPSPRRRSPSPPIPRRRRTDRSATRRRQTTNQKQGGQS